MKRIILIFLSIIFLFIPMAYADFKIGPNFRVSDDGTVGNFYGVDYLPIGWALNGTTGPNQLTALDSTNKANYRDFSGAADNDVFFEWQVPYGIDTTTGITFQVEGWITNATAPADTETVKFVLSGVSIGDSELLSSAQGAAITVTKTFDDSYVQYDRFISGYSGTVTIAGLSAGETVIFLFKRDTTDTYAQSIGVGWLKIKYKMTFLAS